MPKRTTQPPPENGPITPEIATPPVEAQEPPAPPAVPPTAALATAPQPIPGPITAAAVLLFVMATLTGLFGAMLLFAGLIGPFGWMWDPTLFRRDVDRQAFETWMRLAQVFVAGFAVILLAVAGAHLTAGIGILRLRSWARILGLVLAVLGVLVFLIALLGSLISLSGPWVPSGFDPATEEAFRAARLSGAVFGLVTSAIFAGFYLFVLVVLTRRGSLFA